MYDRRDIGCDVPLFIHRKDMYDRSDISCDIPLSKTSRRSEESQLRFVHKLFIALRSAAGRWMAEIREVTNEKKAQGRKRRRAVVANR